MTVEQPLRDKQGEIFKSKCKGKPKPKLKPDKNLRDYENISFLREELPYVRDPWIDEKKIETGYEIYFTKYFYEFKPYGV